MEQNLGLIKCVCVCVWTGERVTGASSRVIIISFYWSGRISKFTSGRRWSVTPEKKEEEEGKKISFGGPEPLRSSRRILCRSMAATERDREIERERDSIGSEAVASTQSRAKKKKTAPDRRTAAA